MGGTMAYFFLAMAVLAGALVPIQGALNARLGTFLHHPMQATLVSFLTGLAACLVVLLFTHQAFPSMEKLSAVPWHFYCGGFLGAIFVSAMLLLMPKIGITNMLAAAIVGQLIMSTAMDHVGAFGNPVIALSPTRVLGVLVLFLGLWLIQRAR